MSREYKDSGIEWIGKIPKEWKTCQLKRLLSFQNGQDYKHVESESGFPVYGSGGVFRYANQFLYDGEAVLFGRKGTVDRPLYVNEKFWTVDTMYYAIPLDNANGKYIYYLSTQLPFDKYQTSTALPSMTQNILGNISVVIPNLLTQQKIADHLDKVCGEVDELISLQETMIEELKAYKQSVITEAVTKGLNPNVPMKDSGIDWIGEIPEHWEVRKIGRLFRLRDEKNYKQMEEVQLLSLYTGIGVFPHGEQEERGNKAVTVEGYKVVHKDDIVVNIILAWMGAIGVSDYDGVTSPAYDVYIPDFTKVVPHYFHYVFRTKGIAAECYKYGRGIMMMRWRTYSSEFKQISVPYPSIEEQQQIASYLDTKCSEIDSLIALKQAKIEELKEYKKSVIYEYVTGKKEVGG